MLRCTFSSWVAASLEKMQKRLGGAGKVYSTTVRSVVIAELSSLYGPFQVSRVLRMVPGRGSREAVVWMQGPVYKWSARVLSTGNLCLTRLPGALVGS